MIVVAVGIVLSFGWLAPDALALTEVPGSEKRMIDQAPDEIEPALMSYTHFGVEYSVAVWMNFDPNIATVPSTLKYTAWTSNGLTNTGSSIPPVAGYARYADPVLVKHPTSTRIFLAALARTETQTGTPLATTRIDSAIVVWYSDNGGWSWSSGRVIATDVWTRSDVVNRPDRWILDKPGIATAPNGTVWVTYTRRGGEVTFNLYDGWLQVQSGTISGSTWSWSGRTTIVAPGGTQYIAPAIMVDADGDVYVLSTRTGDAIELWRDDAQDMNGVFFQQMPALPNPGPFRDTITVGGVTLRAVTVPAVKLDRTRRRICVVWHVSPGTGDPVVNARETYLRFAVYRIDEPIANLRWTNHLFAAGGGVHHVNVGMDHDTNGNVVVTWYRFNPGTSAYWNVGKFVTFGTNHTPSWVSDDPITTKMGDVATLTDDDPDPNRVGLRHIGEYHDVVFTNGKFKAVHIIAVEPWSDPWTFEVRQ
jgi:hypothetical protein